MRSRERSCRTSSQTKAFFFFAVNPSGGVTVFKAGIGECSLDGLVSNLERIMRSTNTDAQYDVALAAFSDHPDPVRPMLLRRRRELLRCESHLRF
ncbi:MULTISPECIES: hypothetical protein [unclassified Cupriavidus]|uniref:hypothetical protein n=1 Tax=unclassified Cupriavidus TaxID=2640874 RepID=UPI001FD7B47D|nr:MULTISPECIES: hypothetical protein [unclassified Cupriavidus]